MDGSSSWIKSIPIFFSASTSRRRIRTTSLARSSRDGYVLSESPSNQLERVSRYGPGIGNLGLPLGMSEQELRFVERDSLFALTHVIDRDRAFNREGRHVESAQDFLEAGAILDVVQQLRQLHPLHAGELLDHERIEVF